MLRDPRQDDNNIALQEVGLVTQHVEARPNVRYTQTKLLHALDFEFVHKWISPLEYTQNSPGCSLIGK